MDEQSFLIALTTYPHLSMFVPNRTRTQKIHYMEKLEKENQELKKIVNYSVEIWNKHASIAEADNQRLRIRVRELETLLAHEKTKNNRIS
jgi:predicted metalloprotease